MRIPYSNVPPGGGDEVRSAEEVRGEVGTHAISMR